MDTLVNRMIRAARLDANLYEEVEADKSTLSQAIAVVLLASVAAGIGNVSSGLAGIIVITLGNLLGWCFWAYLTYLIGTRLLPEPQTQSDFGELLRTIGFSSSPGVIRVLGIIAPLRGVIFIAAALWMLVAMVIAVRQALDYTSTWRALGVCVIGWIVQLVALAAIFLALGIGTPT